MAAWIIRITGSVAEPFPSSATETSPYQQQAIKMESHSATLHRFFYSAMNMFAQLPGI